MLKIGHLKVPNFDLPKRGAIPKQFSRPSSSGVSKTFRLNSLNRIWDLCLRLRHDYIYPVPSAWRDVFSARKNSMPDVALCVEKLCYWVWTPPRPWRGSWYGMRSEKNRQF